MKKNVIRKAKGKKKRDAVETTKQGEEAEK